jgi:peptide/nickel transport system permease protein
MIVTRIALGIGLLLIVSLVIFGATELLPGDIATGRCLGKVGNARKTVAALRNTDGPRSIPRIAALSRPGSAAR